MVNRRGTDANNYYNNNRGSYYRGSSSRGRKNYYTRRGYSGNISKRYHNKPWVRIPTMQSSKPLSRPLSPVEGSEEFMARKIEQTSAIIMRQLLSPNEPMSPSFMSANKNVNINVQMREPIKPKEKQSIKGPGKNTKINPAEINVKELHEKIMNRLTNLNEGRMKNLINAYNNTSLDNAIQLIHKQKRLELSRVLRDMCSSSQNLQKSGELINSIIPDIGIKIEELPIDVIQQLRQTLNLDLDEVASYPEVTAEQNTYDAKDDLKANNSISSSSQQHVMDTASPKPSHVSISSDELNAAVNSIQVKTEKSDTWSCSGTVEIKPEDIVDTQCYFEENQPSHVEEDIQVTQRDQEGNDLINYSITVKEEPNDNIICGSDENEPSNVRENIQMTQRNQSESDYLHSSIAVKDKSRDEFNRHSFAATFSESTVLFPNGTGVYEEQEMIDIHKSISKNILIQDNALCIPEIDINNSENNQTEDNRRNNERLEDAASQTDTPVSSLENFISQIFENDGMFDGSDWNEVSLRVNLVDKCLDYLTEYKKKLIQPALDHCVKVQSLGRNREGIGICLKEISNNGKRFYDESSQTREHVVILEDENGIVTKRQKVEHSTQENTEQNDIAVKTEPADNELEEQNILTFHKLQERIMVIEKVDNQLVIATEKGNIIYVSLKDGAYLHTIDVTSSPITSLIFVRGMNDFVSMYVGCLDRALRIYNFKSRTIIKASILADHIKCMDSMWECIFMGCSGGTLIRYSTKKQRIEFEEKSAGADILVLKAAQEGPRKVLIVGHKQAPIYVRDAMSGLHLRNFSNEAVTPTVYALIINNSYLYCGTANNNILVFSFHEGNLLHRLFAEDCKGISCMKIYQDLLFSGCYNGSIYVYHLKLKKLLMILKGPGGSISCMEVLHNQVIVGTLTGLFGSVEIPAEVYLNR